MSAVRFHRARKAGACAATFAHPTAIEPGDIVMVTTYYPRDEGTRDFGIPTFARYRQCQWCVASQETTNARRGIVRLRLRDRHGDVWQFGEDGLMHTRETAPFSIEHVQRKWGPLHVVTESREQDPVDA